LFLSWAFGSPNHAGWLCKRRNQPCMTAKGLVYYGSYASRCSRKLRPPVGSQKASNQTTLQKASSPSCKSNPFKLSAFLTQSSRSTINIHPIPQPQPCNPRSSRSPSPHSSLSRTSLVTRRGPEGLDTRYSGFINLSPLHFAHWWNGLDAGTGVLWKCHIDFGSVQRLCVSI
jgi:hypothetical protein